MGRDQESLKQDLVRQAKLLNGTTIGPKSPSWPFIGSLQKLGLIRIAEWMPDKSAKLRFVEPPAPEGWKRMSEAPLKAIDVEVLLRDGTTKIAHWAHGGGDDQPRFGPAWFEAINDAAGRRMYFAELSEPVGWRPALEGARH
jgi:hypothetical protein